MIKWIESSNNTTLKVWSRVRIRREITFLITYNTPSRYVYYNPNPKNNHDSGDCVIRAVTKVLDKDWDSVYIGVVMQGLVDKMMPSLNPVWDRYLHNNGYNTRSYNNGSYANNSYRNNSYRNNNYTNNGSYMSGNGYRSNRSYADSKEEMMGELHEMMNEAKSEQERQAFQQFINQLQNM